MRRYVHFLLVLIGLLPLFGCLTQESASPKEGVPQNHFQIIERDAGVVVEPSLDYDFLLGGTEIKVIVSVTANCGCTLLSLHDGEHLDFSKPFHINVQLDKNHFGKGHQDFFIQFADNTALVGRLVYEYVPPPFVTPEELLFFEDVIKKELVFSFPNESGVSIQEVTAPTGITWKRDPNEEKRYGVCLIFEIDRANFEGKQTGTIEVITTSEKMSRFSLPYMVLRK